MRGALPLMDSRPPRIPGRADPSRRGAGDGSAQDTGAMPVSCSDIRDAACTDTQLPSRPRDGSRETVRQRLSESSS